MVHQEAGGLVVELVHQVADAGPHPAGGPVHVALLPVASPGSPSQQVVQVGAQALNPAEVLLADVSGVGLREPGEEGPDAGVQRNDAALGLGLTPLRLHRDG